MHGCFSLCRGVVTCAGVLQLMQVVLQSMSLVLQRV